MPAMQALRLSPTLTRLVLAWFVLTVGVAVASPAVFPKTMELVCSDGGAMKLLVVDDDGHVAASGQHTLDCALCLPVSLPAEASGGQAVQPRPSTHAPAPAAAVRSAALAGAPFPPRGPPPLC